MAQFPWMSPYVAFDNNPIYFIDPFGLEAEDWVKKQGESGAQWHWDDTYKDEASANKAGYDYIKSGSVVEGFKIGDGPTGTVWAGNSESDLKYIDESELTPITPETSSNSGQTSGLHIDEGYGPPKEDSPSSWMNGARIPMDSYPSLGSEGKGVFYDDLTNPFHKDWERNRANADAAGKIVIGNGVIGLSPLLVELAPLAGMYNTSFGLNGGYLSMGLELTNQTTSQIVQNGGISLYNYDLIGLGTSGFLRGSTSLKYEMLQGASGGVVTFTLKDRFQSPLLQKPSYGIITMLNGTLSPLMGKVPIVKGKSGQILNEIMTGFMQGAVDKATK